jgi:hypothetical protein
VQSLLDAGLNQSEVSLALGITRSRVRQLSTAEVEERVPLSWRAWQHLTDHGGPPHDR